MSQNLNEIAAMALVGEFVSVKELLTAAMKGFAEDEDIKSQENGRWWLGSLHSTHKARFFK